MIQVMLVYYCSAADSSSFLVLMLAFVAAAFSITDCCFVMQALYWHEPRVCVLVCFL